jgi:hypothetical protein
MLDELVEKVRNALCGTRYQGRPSKDEIADLIDRRLGSDGRGEDGNIIRHSRNGYRYYITRSYDERKR